MWSRDALLAVQKKSPDEMLYSLTNRGHTTGSLSYKRIDEPAARRQEERRWWGVGTKSVTEVDEVIAAGPETWKEGAYRESVPVVYTGRSHANSSPICCIAIREVEPESTKYPHNTVLWQRQPLSKTA